VIVLCAAYQGDLPGLGRRAFVGIAHVILGSPG
jgi:hypothetical protein